jgi:uncharacterized Zn finger protein
MRSRCDVCGNTVKWELIREYELDGVQWEVYRCPECGREREYAVG